MKKLSTFFFFVMIGVALPSLAKASTVTFQATAASNCHTTTMGFNTGTGCDAGQTCVMSSSSVGNVPTCMPTEAATSVNYTDSAECATACGHACTSNPNSYTGTYYCGAAPAQSTTPTATTQTQSTAPTQNTAATPAAPQGFTALAPIPGLTDQSSTSAVNSTTLANFFNNLYKYCIGLAAILAVIEIIWGGLLISTQDSVGSHSVGREKIQGAIFGLVLVLSPVLVFSIINPSILKLSLSLPELKTYSGLTTSSASRSASGPSFPQSAFQQQCPSVATGNAKVYTPLKSSGQTCASYGATQSDMICCTAGNANSPVANGLYLCCVGSAGSSNVQNEAITGEWCYKKSPLQGHSDPVSYVCRDTEQACNTYRKGDDTQMIFGPCTLTP